MEKNKQMQIGGGILALLLVAFGGMYFTGNLGNSEGDKIRSAAAGVGSTGNAVALDNKEPAKELPAEHKSGNIPGTNVNVTKASTDGTIIKYAQDKHDFGIVDEGTIVEHVYKFKNMGDKDLIISNAKASCGCTVPTWPKQPIPPGGTGEIQVEFNTKGKPGNQTKRVTITANTNPTQTYLQIMGTVRGKEQPAAKGDPHEGHNH